MAFLLENVEYISRLVLCWFLFEETQIAALGADNMQDVVILDPA